MSVVGSVVILRNMISPNHNTPSQSCPHFPRTRSFMSLWLTIQRQPYLSQTCSGELCSSHQTSTSSQHPLSRFRQFLMILPLSPATHSVCDQVLSPLFRALPRAFRLCTRGQWHGVGPPNNPALSQLSLRQRSFETLSTPYNFWRDMATLMRCCWTTLCKTTMRRLTGQDSLRPMSLPPTSSFKAPQTLSLPHPPFSSPLELCPASLTQVVLCKETWNSTPVMKGDNVQRVEIV
mmetsp:Transcript_38329/g.89613  ORF Transcript_38329/g.89613 Transcript_38329/m.89613 type:complete len:234 (+) Transcript_38329:203-904(+)